ncbi:MAG: DUF4249 domain-containing protein [Bacteroidales bacterium]|nr:DUF4249 domain-containing protein [Bacteroidales bacterium]
MNRSFHNSGIPGKIRYPLILLFLLCPIIGCIDPFYPKMEGIKSILVVDALLTSENRSFCVELSRTIQTQDSEPVMVSGSQVIIKDKNGDNSMLLETAAGIYKTDSLQFQVETGNSYVLYIKTPEGDEYQSDPCILNPVKKIDTIYYHKDQEIQNNGSVIHDGLRIYIDSENNGDGKFLRWTYNECWKFRLPDPKRYDYINEYNIPEVSQLKQICYRYHKSDEIIIHSSESAQTNRIENEPILFIASGISDRLLIQYSIEVTQYSLSEKEYRFWEEMKQIDERRGDIFEKQPFSISSNIHNINDPAEPVLGYFQVSATEKKRFFITWEEIADLNLPAYNYDCESIKIGPADYPYPITFDKIYAYYTASGSCFTGPVYGPFGPLEKLVFTSPACADCTLRGGLAEPDFWIDLETPQNRK